MALYCERYGITSSVSTHGTVLRGVGGDVLEGPLDVLVLGQLPGELARVHAAEAQQTVVGRQHAAVKQHDLLVLMVSPAQTACSG